MKVGVLEHYWMAEEGHMMAGYLGDYMKVEDQEDYRLTVGVLEKCNLVVVSGCYMKVVGMVGCTWVQVFHTYLAHCVTVLALKDCKMPQVQAGCTKKIRHHSICSRRSRDHSDRGNLASENLGSRRIRMVLRSQDWACKEQGWCKWAQLRKTEDQLAFHKRMSALRSLRLETHKMAKAPHMILEALHRLELVVTHTHPFLLHMLVLQVCTRAEACNLVWVLD